MKTLTINVPQETDEQEVRMTVTAILFDKCLYLPTKPRRLLAYLKGNLLSKRVNMACLFLKKLLRI